LLSRFLLASLLFHRQYMEQNIGEEFLNISRLFGPEPLYDELETMTKVCYPWTVKAEVRQHLRIDFKGLPAAVINFNYHRKALLELRNLPTVIVGALVEKLEERNIGGGEMTLSKLRDDLVTALERRLDEKLESLNLSTKPSSNESQQVTPPKKPAAVPTFAAAVNDYKIETKGSCLVAWECWHHGKYHRNNDGNGYKSPPWKTLTTSMLHKGAGKGGTQKGYLKNLKFICKQFDDACGIGSTQTPSKTELATVFYSKQVQALIKLAEVTQTGRKS
jgi:hypothetical protein